MSQSTATQPFLLDEPEAVMTPKEADQLSTMQLMKVYQELKAIGVDDETILLRIPGGAKSLTDLSAEQTKEAIKIFTQWLKAYKEIMAEGNKPPA